MLPCSAMALRTCTVSCTDLCGCEHTVEVTADSLYEAVAQGFACFARTIGSMTSAAVRRFRLSSGSPRLNIRFTLRDFERWLESQGRTPGGSKPQRSIARTLEVRRSHPQDLWRLVEAV